MENRRAKNLIFLRKIGVPTRGGRVCHFCRFFLPFLPFHRQKYFYRFAGLKKTAASPGAYAYIKMRFTLLTFRLHKHIINSHFQPLVPKSRKLEMIADHFFAESFSVFAKNTQNPSNLLMGPFLHMLSTTRNRMV